MPIDESDSGDVDDSNYNIEHDWGLRPPISSYPVNDKDSVRRSYIALGLCQPRMKRELFPQHECGGMRRFQPKWFDEFKWLEYSMHTGAAYCFVCYLFKDSSKYPGGDAFINEGFRNWNMKCRIRRHVGAINSAHNEAEEKYNLFMKPRTSIRESIGSNSADFKAQYLARLTWSLKCIRYLLRQGLAFRGNFEEVNMVVLENAPHNCQMIDHKIQKQLIAACAHETTKFIIEELGDECFAILADESSDAYQQEQLALCLRYVNKNGEPVERFLESSSAYYVHCFAHQLQLTLVAVAKENIDCQWFFGQLAYLLNVLDMSCKKIRMLRIAQAEYMIEALKLGEIETGQGLNQEMGLARPVFTSFEFVFLLHMMNEIFGYTNDLCNALQKREQDIVNAMDLLELTKLELDVLRRDAGWEEFIKNVTSFCQKHKVKVVDMDGKYIPIQRSAKFYRGVTNYHRFHADMFLGVIDRQLQELNSRCMAAFNPANSFSAFDNEKLVKLAGFYPHDFDFQERNQLRFQLHNYINDVRNDENFKNLRSLADLSMMLVKRDMVSRGFFSAMNTIKNKLRSKMGQDFLNNCLTTFIEREFFLQAKDEDIINYFQAMKDQKVNL
ncbi:hypothetical protein PVAP13_6NG015516 [Panicum virgatum]|uniref:TTF-type domain-containing protein n=1 Tax=Panicum virgatum TaxID=38727 RepID=A0A8T0QT02_PANVG|nr:hypothetical protein PVAP13_6NG015392 [Panicum virgatum]KAG2576260.1 hypothetical protein PVAP13_6NG015516 [Panicum virgatum]